MRIAKLSLICLVAFAFMVGCGMIGKEAEMSETANTTSAGKAVMEAEAETMAKESMEGAAVEEVTLNVTGMTWGACTSKVQAALSGLTGVSEVVSVSSDTNTAVVKVEKGKVTTDALTEAVKGAGFSAEVAQ